MLTGIGDRLIQPADHQNLSLLLGHKYAIDQALSIGSIGESTSSMAFESVDLLFSSVICVVRTQSRPT